MEKLSKDLPLQTVRVIKTNKFQTICYFILQRERKERKGEREEGRKGQRRKEEKELAPYAFSSIKRVLKMKPIGCHGTLVFAQFFLYFAMGMLM